VKSARESGVNKFLDKRPGSFYNSFPWLEGSRPRDCPRRDRASSHHIWRGATNASPWVVESAGFWKGWCGVKFVEPKVFLVGETQIIGEGLQAYLDHVGVPKWTTDAPSDAEKLCEVMGRLCYRSFEPGLNPNVTRVREGNAPYLRNIVNVGHGSVLEHGLLNFIFADVSRVVTHELVRHRAGTAISQESLRFVRLESLSAYVPVHIRENEEGMEIFARTLEQMEDLQRSLAALYAIDEEKHFAEKKKLTSAFRRMAPIGLATTIGWSCNFRTLRHVIEHRTDPHAEEEIRVLFSKVFEIVRARMPNLFGDYEVEMVDGLPWVKTAHGKI